MKPILSGLVVSVLFLSAASTALAGNALGVKVKPDPDFKCGLRITGVTPASPAAKLGLTVDDLLLEVNGTKLTTRNDLVRALKTVRGSFSLSWLQGGRVRHAVGGRLDGDWPPINGPLGEIGSGGGVPENPYGLPTVSSAPVHGLGRPVPRVGGIRVTPPDRSAGSGSDFDPMTGRHSRLAPEPIRGPLGEIGGGGRVPEVTYGPPVVSTDPRGPDLPWGREGVQDLPLPREGVDRPLPREGGIRVTPPDRSAGPGSDFDPMTGRHSQRDVPPTEGPSGEIGGVGGVAQSPIPVRADETNRTANGSVWWAVGLLQAQLLLGGLFLLCKRRGKTSAPATPSPA